MNLSDEHKTEMTNSSISNIELLAPVGGFEQLQAAINFGADAVYLGLDRFSMRAKAENFTFENLPQAIELAHNKGVKVHVAINTQMHESDISKLPLFFKNAQDAGADALIVGDLGAMALAKKFAPDVDLHVSTQSAVANSKSANVFYKMGAKRVVLARELTLDEIATLHANVPKDLEIEVFVHGAQCMAQSGRCLISSYLCSGRSANEGACTQPCRWGFRVEEEKRPGQKMDVEEAGGLTYLFNAKDLCMIDHLRELKDAGVDSIKIEGRNKKAFYVATVVNAYRRVLDGEAPANFMSELECVSHRPFSTGFYYGAPGQSMDFDGYTQQTLHVADVLECSKLGSSYQLKIRCRNKILDGEELEALAPGKVIENVKLTEFNWCGAKQEEVNRPGEIYIVQSNKEVAKNSFLRKRVDLTTSRCKVVL
jgi:U32 family peptidase